MGPDSEGNGLTTVNDSTLDSVGEDHRDRFADLAVTILHHPDGRRVGEQARLPDLAGGIPVALSRVQPKFRSLDRGRWRPLSHPRLSRKPVWLRMGDRSLSIAPSDPKLRVAVDDGLLGSGGRAIDRTQIEDRGVFITLGGCVLLWLHVATPGEPPLIRYGIRGLSPAIRAVRDAVERVARLPVPVLIRGESGVGKELVAHAIHRSGDRGDGPWVAVNMAAIPVSMAAAELFGHGRGAFTGADQARDGCFARADHGTLFLDEIGETPLDIQPQLLRALESREIQPVGATSRTVDIRLIAATDADLQGMVEDGRFRRSLLHRLQAAVIDVPPLRQRPVDIPLLLHHFLREYLEELQATSLLDNPVTESKRRAWLRPSVITRLMRYPFPGNVRELRNIASQMAIHDHDQARARLPAAVEAALPATVEAEMDSSSSFGAERASTQPAALPAGTARGDSLDAELVRDALRENRWNITRTARMLGVSKNTLTARIREIPGLRLAGELEPDDIAEARRKYGGDVALLADKLQVSVHGLRLRLRDLESKQDKIK